MKHILFILLFACFLSTSAQVPQGNKTKQNTTTTPLNTISNSKRDTFTDSPVPTSAPKAGQGSTKAAAATSSQKPGSQSAKQGAPTGKVYNVRTAEEFLNALGSNRTIRVNSHFNLTPALASYISRNKIKTVKGNNCYYPTSGIYVKDWGEYELTFYGIQNLTIEGVNVATAHIQIEHYAAFVLSFENCSNIKLKNLTLGHVEQGACDGGVVQMNSCSNCSITNCDLYGCGTYGICADGSDHITFSNSTIRDCSYGIMWLDGCSDVHFTGSKFIRNEEFELIGILNCAKVDFTNCKISQNKGTLFHFNCNVLFKNCTISHDSSKMGTTGYANYR